MVTRKLSKLLLRMLWLILALGGQLNADWYVDPANEFAVCTAPRDQARPAIYGDIVVWEDWRSQNFDWDIYGYDLFTGQEFAICINPSDQKSPAIYGDIVVWEDQRPDNRVWHIYGMNLSTGQEFAICANNVWNDLEPAIYGNIVVWTGIRTAIDWYTWWGIYGYDLSTGQEFPISIVRWADEQIYKEMPKIYGNVVIWWEHRPFEYNRNIRGKNLSTDQEFTVCADPSRQGLFDIYGDIVVWEDYRRTGYVDIYGTYLSTGQEFAITTNGCSAEPHIYGNIVVWREWCPGFWPAIYGKDLSTGQEFAISTYSSPAIYGDIVVWADGRNGNGDIYGNRILSGIQGDFNRDGLINFVDFAVFASYWLAEDCSVGAHCQGADFEPDGDVDFDDLMHFCDKWLSGAEP